jgi:hypothetical protein
MFGNLGRKCLEEVNGNYLKKVYQSLPSESRPIPESNLPLDRLGKTIRNNIKEHHGSGLEVTLQLVEDLTKSILMAYVKAENEKALLAQNMEDPKKDLSTRKNEVTIENLVRFSWEKLDFKHFQIDSSNDELILSIQNEIEQKWNEKGYLDQNAIDEIYRKNITPLKEQHQQRSLGIYPNLITDWKNQLLIFFDQYLERIFSRLGITLYSDHNSTTQFYNRHSITIREFVKSSTPPIEMPIQFEPVVELATKWLLYNNPDAWNDTKKIEKEVLQKQVEKIQKEFNQTNEYFQIVRGTLTLNPNVAIRQAQELAEKMAGHKLPDLMETLQEK